MKNCEIYEGLLLTLKKQMKHTGPKPKGQFCIDGRYNALDIRYINRWYDMCPQTVNERDSAVPAEDDYYDRYILKVYFPSALKIQELNESGASEEEQFDYDAWRVIGQEIEGAKKEGGKSTRYEELCSKFPVLTIAFINISRDMARGKGDLLANIAGCLVNAAKKSNVSMKEVHAGLFPTLGFCDYVLLFLSEEVTGVKKLLDNLKTESVPNEKMHAVSDVYTVTGGRQECNSRFALETKNDNPQRNMDITEYQYQFSNMIQKLEEVAEKFKKPKRAIYAIQSLMTMFLELICSSHCFDLEAVIGDMFQALGKNIDNNVEEIKMLSLLGENNLAEISVQDLWKALRKFRKFVGNYLSDMQRSEHFLTEGYMPVHQSIGSSTKLLLFYNRFITKVAAKLVERENGNETYKFLVTSGGTDVTIAYDLFAHLDPVKPENMTIAVLTIPEMSLYDIRGTMFRLMHECLHFCGERKRKKRFDYVLEALSAYSALHFCEQEKRTIRFNFENGVFFALNHMFSELDLDKLRKEWEEEMKPFFLKKNKNLNCLSRSFLKTKWK